MEEGSTRDARLRALVRSCCFRFFQGAYEPGDNVTLNESTLLREELWMDHLGFEDFAEYLCTHLGPLAGTDAASISSCETLGSVVDLGTSQLSGKRLPATLLPSEKTGLTMIWNLEARGAISMQNSELFNPGAGYSKDDKLFARLRRSYQELKRPFVFYWNSLSVAEQERLLFESALIPENANDTVEYPASLLLMPSMHVSGLVGQPLLDLLDSRATGDFRTICRGDMETARSVSSRFSCPVQWDRKVVVLENRRIVEIKSHKDEARLRDQLTTGQAVPGRLWAVYCALTGSLQGLLMTILDDFRRFHFERSKKGKISAKHSLCDVCGTFQEKLQICSRCKNRWFCSKQCQTVDWPLHKKNCSNPSFSLKFE